MEFANVTFKTEEPCRDYRGTLDSCAICDRIIYVEDLGSQHIYDKETAQRYCTTECWMRALGIGGYAV